MKHILRLLVVALLLGGTFAHAQTVQDSNPHPNPVGIVSSNIAMCDPFHPMNCAAPNSSGIVPVSGLFSATISGFQPAALYSTPLAVTSTTSNVALPAGTVVAIYNTGANAAYTKLGTSNAVTATTSNDVIPAGGGCGFTVGTNTYLAAITATSTTTLNISGGSGLVAGCWGGGTGGGGGSTTIISPLGTNTIANSVAVTPATSSLFPISAASLPLPSGASTSAKQPALGTAGVSATDVITVQGIGSGTIIPVDASSTAIQGSAAGVAPPAGNNFLSIQGGASGTAVPMSAASLPLPTGASSSANQPTNAAQASTTAAQTGPLVQGAVTTGAPSYTTAQTDPISLDPAGNTRVTEQWAGNAVSGTANSTTTGTTSLVAAVASHRLLITSFSCANTGANSSLISFQDGSGGTTLWTTIVPAGWGSNMGNGTTQLFKTTSGNALYYAAGTASTTIYCSAAGFSQ